MLLYWHIRQIVLSHDDADDATQNTFIQVWKHLSKFKRESKFSTWIYRIATNEALQILRKKKNTNSIDDETVSSLSSFLIAELHVDGSEIELNLQKALLQLPNKQRLVFNMKYFDDMKYTEIADILGTSVGSLKASYHIAVKKIKEFLIQD